ncbi:MAG: M20/M25/M40 family metallo-hydrolase [Planctomycetia bacterium]|nr:M20/M25/M40 family metallo-hydrolase [Planctomycetia bacterium]
MRVRLSGVFAVAAFVFLSLCSPLAQAADNAALRAAADTITAGELHHHVAALADDAFEGRESGSRGGRAAGGYLQLEFKKFGLAPAGDKGTYFQLFDPSSRNVLGILEGSDPALRDQVVLLSAHYDHVGYGNARNSYGPTGHIHNGADDNASGVATLLEVADACCRLEPRPKRSILFALWDGEEKGLLGSKHWLSRPTVRLGQVRIMVNMDMVGRLRNNKLEITGARTAAGLRKLASRPNGDEPMLLDFTWEMKDNSDHHPFYARGVPILMAHTGLHSDYHRPSDDVEKLNIDGMRRVARYVFGLVTELADEPELPRFRDAGRRESQWTQQSVERPMEPLPSRLGLNWDPHDVSAPGLRVIRVTAGAPAAQAGLKVGDRLLSFAGQELSAGTDLAGMVASAESPAKAVVQRVGAEQSQELSIALRGQPAKLGIAWREDDAEPGSVKLIRVVPASPAARAGLRVLDRVLAVNGQEFADGPALQQLLNATTMPYELLIERGGHLEAVTVGAKPAGMQ